MAIVLADAMATVIHANSLAEGSSLLANIIPIYAKGRAKRVCSNLMADDKFVIFFTPHGRGLKTFIMPICVSTS